MRRGRGWRPVAGRQEVGRLLEGFRRFLVHTEAAERFAELLVGVCVIGLKANHLLVSFHGFAELTCLEIGRSGLTVGIGGGLSAARRCPNK